MSFVCTASSAEIVRGPYLQLGTPDSVIIKWRTDEPTDAIVRYGTNLASLSQSVTNSSAVINHEAQLVSLNPDTKYFYRISSSSQTLARASANLYFVTHPIPGTPKPTRIWVIGDSGTASAGHIGSALVRDAYYKFAGTNQTDVWLMLGDNAYYSGTDSEYQKAVFDVYSTLLRNTILWSTLGNHDVYYGPRGSFPYFDIFSFPAEGEAGGVPSGTEKYYSFDYANIHFVCLDSEMSDRSTTGAMWSWLEQDLQANTNDWLIAFWHSPPYSKGSHDSDDLMDSGGSLIDMRVNFVSLLESYGVDLVLSGHSHIYERSFPLQGHYGFSSSLEPSMIKDSGSGRPDETGPYIKSAPDSGTVYVVAGSSGWVFYRTGYHPAMFFDALQLGSLVLDVHGNRLDAKFLRETGAVDDYFTILKQAAIEPFRISLFELNKGQITLRWKSVPERTYRVQSTSNFDSPEWTSVSDPIVATGTTTSWEGSLPPGANQQFYRVVEESVDEQ